MKGASDLPGPTLSPCVCFPEKMEEENFHSCLCESTTWPAFAHFCVSLVQSPRALLPSWGLGLQSSGLWMLSWSPPYEHPYNPHLNNGSTGLYEAHLGHHLYPPLVFSSPPFPATHLRGVTTPAWSTLLPSQGLTSCPDQTLILPHLVRSLRIPALSLMAPAFLKGFLPLASRTHCLWSPIVSWPLMFAGFPSFSQLLSTGCLGLYCSLSFVRVL